MLDVTVLLLALRALCRAMRARWLAGSMLGAAFVLLWVAIAAVGWADHAAERFGVAGMWMPLLLGLGTASPRADAPRAIAAGCALVAFLLANRRVSAIPPLRADYLPASRAALGFLAPLVLTGGEVALFLLAGCIRD